MARLAVKLVPGASHSNIAGWFGDSLRIRVKAVAEKGKANAALVSLIAQTLELPSDAVRLIGGKTSAHKVLEITGLSQQELKRRLQKLDL
ncbi:MAG: DUF167 domain-containing protein [Gammaproteobacteria bacterium]|nr:DUF167 domain-containing protein [Gammaproteobacteria bacterium]